MNRKLVFVLWAVLAWPLPAAIAGALGWKGIWGSGSAFADFLIPMPVAGGALHLPSFLLVSLILFTQPWAGRLGGYVRGLLFAGTLVGIVTLLDLDKLQLAVTTDLLSGRFWQENPLGLFIVSDCVIAQLFVGALGGRSPEDARAWGISVLAALSIAALYAAVSLQADPRQKNPFVHAGAREGTTRGDEMIFYYSKLPLGSEAFRAAAAPLLEQYHPRSNINTEDIALFFFDTLATAQSQNKDGAKYTVCLYQDGTPSVWARGSHDCFSDHETFSERLEKAFRVQPAALPQDVRLWRARHEACLGRTPPAPPPGQHIDNRELRTCNPENMARMRTDLLRKFDGDAHAVAALTPPPDIR